MKTIFFTLFVAAFSSISYAAGYDSYQNFRGRPISLNVDLQYYKTDTNFDANGSRVQLPSGYSFQNMNVNPRLRWQFGPSLAVLGGFNYGSSEAVDFSFTRKNALINRLDLAGEYLFISDVWMRLFGRLSYALPLEKIDYAGDTVMTSNGAYEIYPEVILNMDFEGGISSFIKGGVNVRGEGLSTLGTYGVGSELRFSDYGIGAAVLGQLTIKEDEHTLHSSYRDNLNDQVNAGSKMFNSINPNLHNLEINFNFLLGSQSLFKVYAGTTLVGSNTSTGYYAGANLNWVFDSPAAFSSPHKNRRKEPEPLFKEKTDDGVNQDYFKSVTPVTPNYIQQIEGSHKNLEETTSPDPDESIQVKKAPTKTKGYKIKLRKVKRN